MNKEIKTDLGRQIILPQADEVSACRIGNEQKIIITVKGHEDGYCDFKIVPSLAQIFPPIYMVTAEPCPVIGYFPYTVTITIPYSTDLSKVYFQCADGTKEIPIYDVMEKSENTPKALTSTTDKQVTGYAYNSSNMQVAIDDAISKLQKKFPSNVSAVIKESGFVAAGSPVGIAYFYVVMEQQ